MKTLELFAGTQSFSKVARKRGHATFTVEVDPSLDPDWCGDVRAWTPMCGYDVVWASPPCTAFSVASLGHHWGGGFRAYIPKTDGARLGVELVQRTLDIIKTVDPKWWFIENPRGVLRKLPLMAGFRRVSLSYCQYGDDRMKPTDIWTNVPPEIWTPKPMCKNGSPCHVRAPRGSRTGTQGLKGAKERGVIPPALFNEIFDSLEAYEMRNLRQG